VLVFRAMKRWIGIAMAMACVAPRGGAPEHPHARVEPELDYTFRYVAGAAPAVQIERAFFEDAGVPRFVVIVFPLGTGEHEYGGTAYTRSFDLALASGTKLEPDVLARIAHEYFHTWNGGLIAPEAFEDLTYWFTEGFTSFYAARLRYRAA
jgi:predicted metalloprotease with PDZ domain